MKKIGMHELRREYLDFFRSKEHKVVPSFSLVPKNDKSLLLIGAGMAPLKKYFTGELNPPSKRMSTCQTCIRTGDIDNVGKTDRHGTFFEMLGNFSFGDYFKREAIGWAWEFLTERLEIEKELIWVTVYLDDDEAYKIWNEEIGIPAERIVRLGKEDNFWELEVGPSGPCSEIYIDRGESHGCGCADCKPGCDCDRFMEVWNLVFTQFDKDHEGEYHPLPNPNIDTGMGLERMTTILEGVDNIFEVGAIVDIINKIAECTGYKYKTDKDKDVSVRVITDHTRAMTFLVADGVIPSNEGRGYVLRRLIRRAARHGKLLGIKGKFLSKIVKVVIDSWSVEYDKLSDNADRIIKVIETEEEKFQETIDSGMAILDEMIANLKNNGSTELDGDEAFKLYDTYGFPFELTEEIIRENKMTVDSEGFNSAMKVQKERARAARGSGDSIGWDSSSETSIYDGFNNEFVGYTCADKETEIIGIFKDGAVVDGLNEGEEGVVVLETTPFYGESGGQTGDTGRIFNDEFAANVVNTRKTKTGVFLHHVLVEEGTLTASKVTAEIDDSRRSFIRKNHTATHLLHRALKDVLGEHVNQAGSEVLSTGLRFDFSHYEAISAHDLAKIEQIVNEKIYACIDVVTEIKSLTEATNEGVVGLFEDKYGNEVRVLKIGNYSKELCGGTHVKNTAEIGMFKILSESGIASGVRRIEAITSKACYELINSLDAVIDNVATAVKSNKTNVVQKVSNLVAEHKDLQKELERLNQELAMGKSSDLMSEMTKIGTVDVIAKRLDGFDVDSLREIADDLRSKKSDNLLVALASNNNGKVALLVALTKDLVQSGYKAGAIIKTLAKITEGGGGGRDDIATAGGKNPDKIDEALAELTNILA